MVTLSLNSSYDDLPPGIRDAVERIERSDKDRRRRDPGQRPAPQFLETWKGIAALAGIISMAFTGGYNWREVTSVRADHDAFKKLAEDPVLGFMPREVADTRYNDMRRRFDEIQKTLEQIRNDIGQRSYRRD